MVISTIASWISPPEESINEIPSRPPQASRTVKSSSAKAVQANWRSDGVSATTKIAGLHVGTVWNYDIVLRWSATKFKRAGSPVLVARCSPRFGGPLGLGLRGTGWSPALG